ncbi:MAG TPA: NAD(P)H-hydrate dehydratase [Gaiella sp.]|jgi:NAD(P)H-hydrate epimerase|nr:NAD(P)H-hydrate dehydratase [Gaiella sp.]
MHEPLYSVEEMRAAEARYPGYPESAPQLMERAGRAVADECIRSFPEARRFAVVCGGGSNGGDGRVAADYLRQAGRDATETHDPAGAEVVVDALFGTGFHGAPRPEAAAVIERINAANLPVVSVDVPSGVNASTGEIEGAAIEADVTVTFHGVKVGLVVAPGRFHAGRVAVARIGLEHAPTAVVRATPGVLRRVPRRGAPDSKFTAGSLLVVGGSPGTTGAPVLTASAALRADAGYVTLAVPSGCLTVAEILALEPVKRGFEHGSALETLASDLSRSTALAVGPGLGRSAEAQALVHELLALSSLPAVVDADALFGLEPPARTAPTVLTPHAGELARLLAVDSAWVSAHRLEAAAQAAERFGAIVLLKGADTIVRAPDGTTVVCDSAPPSLATAGTGDVLTGVIGAFLAKGVDATDAAVAAAIAHGLAAAAVPHQAGLIASDVVAALPAVLA